MPKTSRCGDPERPSQYPSEQKNNLSPTIGHTTNSMNLSWQVNNLAQRAMRLTGKKFNVVLAEALQNYIDDFITNRKGS